MKNPKSVEDQVKALKKNIANQLTDCSMTENHGEPMSTDHTSTEPVSTDRLPLDHMHERPKSAVSPQRTRDPIEDNDSFVGKMYAKKLSMAGVEMVASVISAYLVAWGIGALFTLSSFWRIILGTLFAFAVNALAVYRMMRQ
jgi:hypothetical protein